MSQIRGLAHMEKEPQSAMGSHDTMEAATPDSPATISANPMPFSPLPFSGARGPENGSLLLSSPFSPSPAPHFEPSPAKQSPLSEANSPINCSRDPHRVSPVPRRKQVGKSVFNLFFSTNNDSEKALSWEKEPNWIYFCTQTAHACMFDWRCRGVDFYSCIKHALFKLFAQVTEIYSALQLRKKRVMCWKVQFQY